ncbi:MAG: S1 RNA-binding domain-containing protein [Cyanobacteria bacterium REEB67]|nr:S1 RNA-binding domain-containing protein [Cyanobacteria bacterium REEB67]
MNQTRSNIRGGNFSQKNSGQVSIDIKALYQVGQEVQGKIKGFIKAGSDHPDLSAVIDLSSGGTALMLYNEIPGYPRNKIAERYKQGETIDVEVTAVRPNKNRISVSLRPVLLRNAAAQIERGDIVEATITNSVNYGYFVSLGGVLEALLHNDNLDQGFHGNREKFEIGEKTEVVVLKIEEQGKRIGVGRKQLFD